MRVIELKTLQDLPVVAFFHQYFTQKRQDIHKYIVIDWRQIFQEFATELTNIGLIEWRLIQMNKNRYKETRVKTHGLEETNQSTASTTYRRIQISWK